MKKVLKVIGIIAAIAAAAAAIYVIISKIKAKKQFGIFSKTLLFRETDEILHKDKPLDVGGKC